MSRPDKKARLNARKKAKQLEVRRKRSTSPAKRLADATGGTLRCWMSLDYETHDQANIFVYKSAGGLSGIACFLVDRGIAGLKDCWLTMHAPIEQLQEMLATARGMNTPMREASLGEIRLLIAGAARWAFDHGMRLPKDWQKPAAVVGGLEDWRNADVSDFVKGFAGHPEDLRRRLIGEPIETFLQRRDIEFIFSEDAPFLDHETGNYLNNSHDDFEEADSDDVETLDELLQDLPSSVAAQLDAAAEQLANRTGNWLASRKEEASPELLDAWHGLLMSIVLSQIAIPGASKEEFVQFHENVLDRICGTMERRRRMAFGEAVAQTRSHLAVEPRLMDNALK